MLELFFYSKKVINYQHEEIFDHTFHFIWN